MHFLLTKHNLKIPHKYAVTTITSNKPQYFNVNHIACTIHHLFTMNQNKIPFSDSNQMLTSINAKKLAFNIMSSKYYNRVLFTRVMFNLSKIQKTSPK